MAEVGTNRLPAPWGSRIDRARSCSFTFAGRRYRGYAGDTLASALLANDVRILSRSFKYHRPRGALTMNGLDSNTFVQVGGQPNVRADSCLLEDRLVVNAQNLYGSLGFDAGRIFDYLGGFLPVGFYYQAFYKPGNAWRRWEPLIRRLAGLGRIDITAQHQPSDIEHLFTPLAVIGAGPAGMAAALTAAEAGTEVLLIDREPEIGGALTYRRPVDEADAGELRQRVTVHPRIRCLTGTTCTGWFGDNLLTLMQDDIRLKVRADRVILAAGTLDQPAVFRHNDLPGILLGSAVQRLLRLYGVSPGRRAAVFTADDRGYEVALDLLDAGVEVAALIDSRSHPPAAGAITALTARGVAVFPHHGLVAAQADRRGALAGIRVAALGSDGTPGAALKTIPCDTLSVSALQVPAAQLVCHAGGRMIYSEAAGRLTVEVPGGLGQAAMAGAVNGMSSLADVIADGERAGAAADPAAPAGNAAPAGPTVFPHPDGRDFIDFDEDLQVKDIRRAVAEGFDDLDLVKRYATVVMGPSQGKQSALNNLLITSAAAGRPLDGAALTTQRPPFFPEPIRLLAGRSFHPVRLTPMHAQHEAAGAQMMTAGAWMRPAWYGAASDQARCVAAEVAAVRTGVGMIDVTTLGKLEVIGPDAAELMNRMYTFAYLKQPVGKTRYVLMTDETGAIIDDGVSCRVADDRFYVTATTSGVDGVYAAMQRWSTMWRLDVTVSNVTSAFAAVNVAGPRAREVLERAGTTLDLSREACPYLAYREGAIAGIPARVLRVGFVGELGYEIHVPAEYGVALWDAVDTAGSDAGIRPFGVEAQRALRLEKGHIIVGQDTDGLTTPHHAGMGWAVASGKPFFIGQRAITAIAGRGLDRTLVGFRAGAGQPAPDECNLVIEDGAIAGRVTSVVASASCEVTIGLAYVPPGRAEPGTPVQIRTTSGAICRAEVAATPFYDPGNARQDL